MKVILLDRKRLGATAIIIGLMFVLLGLEKAFDGKLKVVTLLQGNISSLQQYQGLQSKLQYKLPSDWITQEKKFSGNEIIYHNDFSSKDAEIHGFVQVWNLNQDLKIFLEQSKKVAMEYNKFKEYEIKPISLKGKPGYEVTYVMITPSQAVYRGDEYFIKVNNKLIRFAFYVREENYKENLSRIFRTITETLEFKE